MSTEENAAGAGWAAEICVGFLAQGLVSRMSAVHTQVVRRILGCPPHPAG